MPLPKIAWISILAAASLSPAFATPAHAQGAQIQHVAVLNSRGATEIQIETSKHLVPMTQLVTDPDRLVIDFPDARPGPALRALTVNRGEVRSVHASLFSVNPPITRVVVELNSAEDFELIPSGNSVIVKLVGPVTTAAVVPPASASASPPAQSEPQVAVQNQPEPPAPKTSEPASPPPAKTAVATALEIPASKTPEPKITEAKTLEVKTAEVMVPPTPAPNSSEPAPEPKAPEPKAPEIKTAEAGTPAVPATAPRSSEPPAPKKPEPRAPEVWMAEVMPAESAAPQPNTREPKASAPASPEPVAELKTAEPKQPMLKTRDGVAVAERPETAQARPTVTRASVTVHPSLAPATLPPGATAQVRKVAVLKSGGATEIEIEATERIVPEVQVVTGPDRLVIDFPGATPGPQLRALAVNQGEVKGVRVGLWSAKPPVTRVVLDLKSPQAYQLFPLGKSVIVKLGGTMGVAVAPSPAAAPQSTASAIEPAKRFEVSFHDGMLSVLSTKGSLAEVLAEIRQQTGADVAIPAGAEQEEVAASLGPGTPRDVVSQLLNGSRYNFILVGADNDPNKLERVILSPKGAGDVIVQDATHQPDPSPVAQAQSSDRSVSVAPVNTPPLPEQQPQGDSMPPEIPPQPGDPQPAPN